MPLWKCTPWRSLKVYDLAVRADLHGLAQAAAAASCSRRASPASRRCSSRCRAPMRRLFACMSRPATFASSPIGEVAALAAALEFLRLRRARDAQRRDRSQQQPTRHRPWHAASPLLPDLMMLAGDRSRQFSGRVQPAADQPAWSLRNSSMIWLCRNGFTRGEWLIEEQYFGASAHGPLPHRPSRKGRGRNRLNCCHASESSPLRAKRRPNQCGCLQWRTSAHRGPPSTSMAAPSRSAFHPRRGLADPCSHGVSAAALRPETRPNARHSPILPVPWYR